MAKNSLDVPLMEAATASSSSGPYCTYLSMIPKGSGVNASSSSSSSPSNSFEAIATPARNMESEKLRKIRRRKELKEIRKCTKVFQYQTLGDDKNYNLAAVLESLESNSHKDSLSSNSHKANHHHQHSSSNYNHQPHSSNSTPSSSSSSSIGGSGVGGGGNAVSQMPIASSSSSLGGPKDSRKDKKMRRPPVSRRKAASQGNTTSTAISSSSGLTNNCKAGRSGSEVAEEARTNSSEELPNKGEEDDVVVLGDENEDDEEDEDKMSSSSLVATVVGANEESNGLEDPLFRQAGKMNERGLSKSSEYLYAAAANSASGDSFTKVTNKKQRWKKKMAHSVDVTDHLTHHHNNSNNHVPPNDESPFISENSNHHHYSNNTHNTSTNHITTTNNNTIQYNNNSNMSNSISGSSNSSPLTYSQYNSNSNASKARPSLNGGLGYKSAPRPDLDLNARDFPPLDPRREEENSASSTPNSSSSNYYPGAPLSSSSSWSKPPPPPAPTGGTLSSNSSSSVSSSSSSVVEKENPSRRNTVIAAYLPDVTETPSQSSTHVHHPHHLPDLALEASHSSSSFGDGKRNTIQSSHMHILGKDIAIALTEEEYRRQDHSVPVVIFGRGTSAVSDWTAKSEGFEFGFEVNESLLALSSPSTTSEHQDVETTKPGDYTENVPLDHIDRAILSFGDSVTNLTVLGEDSAPLPHLLPQVDSIQLPPYVEEEQQHQKQQEEGCIPFEEVKETVTFNYNEVINYLENAWLESRKGKHPQQCQPVASSAY